MDANLHNPRDILNRYDLAVASCVALGGAGGFSGAQLWRIESSSGLFVLRRWPTAHPTPQHLAWIHAVVEHARQYGFYRLPQPLRAKTGETFLAADSHLWELDHWLPGVADFDTRPTGERLVSAMETLADFHCSVACFPMERAVVDQSPGVAERLSRVASLRAGGLAQLERAIPSPATTRLTQLAAAWIDHYRSVARRIERELSAAAALHVPLQPALRDVWHDHILFEGDTVTGILDLGAMRIESPAADVARLLGSLVGDDTARWQTGLAAYAARRPMSPDELRLAAAFDESTVALSGLNWAKWLFLDNRRFADPIAIEQRLAAGLARLATLEKRWAPATFDAG